MPRTSLPTRPLKRSIMPLVCGVLAMREPNRAGWTAEALVAVLVWLLPRIASIRTVAVRAFGSWVVAIALMLGALGLLGH